GRLDKVIKYLHLAVILDFHRHLLLYF
ncbi:MAG: hypothetical protein H6Q55_2472, partial [Deltaproteobacteria bacterium]|nr:hypothetical protein [Deltaproteobacteria bacterium]